MESAVRCNFKKRIFAQVKLNVLLCAKNPYDLGSVVHFCHNDCEICPQLNKDFRQNGVV